MQIIIAFAIVVAAVLVFSAFRWLTRVKGGDDTPKP